MFTSYLYFSIYLAKMYIHKKNTIGKLLMLYINSKSRQLAICSYCSTSIEGLISSIRPDSDLTVRR